MRHDAALSVPLFCLYYAVAVVILVVEVTQQLPLLKMVHGMKALPGWFRYMLVVRQLYTQPMVILTYMHCRLLGL